jgi:hypothetical protein
MEKLLIAAVLARLPGNRLIVWSGKLPRGLQFLDFIVTVESFYTRLYIYQLGYPQSIQHCCNKPTSVIPCARRGGTILHSAKPAADEVVRKGSAQA